MAMKYKKKPVVVEAVKWTGENHAEMCEFIDPEVFEIIPRVGLVIHTLEGDHHERHMRPLCPPSPRRTSG